MILHGDCLEQMKTLADNSVDAVVTDPPYGLSFMGKKWDYEVPTISIWKETIRVIKPGGHLVSFGGTRTYHRLACAIEDAGFEIRDQMQWLYGSGFPKSLDISKAIDKAAGAKREVIGKRKSPYTSTARNDSESIGQHNVEVGEDGYELHPITAPATSEAKQWQGWGTALKPANEPIVLARKPLSEKTVALNVQKWGVGGLNIDGCRIEAVDQAKLEKNWDRETRTDIRGGNYGNGKPSSIKNNISAPQGRWPANLLLDEAAAEMLDEQSGVSKSRPDNRNEPSSTGDSGIYGGGYRRMPNALNDSGGASRFFYVAKASKSERNRGLEGMNKKLAGALNMRTDAHAHAHARAHGQETEPAANHHPTVKPIKLMEYLCKLITPNGGTILDPFMGSGTTGIACKRLGFNFIGIEMNAEYLEIAKKRIEHASSVGAA